MRSGASVVLALALMVGCGAKTSMPSREEGGLVEATDGGSSPIDPGQLRPKLPSSLAGKVLCGTRFCEEGEYCCNPSCGICAPEGGFCSQPVCAGPAPTGACTSSSDCRIFSSYCGECACLALSIDDPDPVCRSRPVQCLADPCMNRQPACITGRCAPAGP